MASGLLRSFRHLPVPRPVIALEDAGLTVARDGLRWIVFGAVSYLRLGQVHIDVPVVPVDAFNPLGRQQDLAPRQPAAGIHDDIADEPVLVVDDKILHASNL